LRQIAGLIDHGHISLDIQGKNDPLGGSNEESRVIVQPLDDGDPSQIGVDAGGTLPLPMTLPDGLQTVMADGESFRVLVRTMAAGERFAVAQESSFRDQIAWRDALRTVMSFLILVPILLLIVAQIVRRLFRPIAELSSELDRRSDQELHPVEEGCLPIEVRPFAVAINRLLARVGQSMEKQRRFIADAAHELRSPLAALSLQAERLAQAEMSKTAFDRLAALRKGIERARNLMEQLLALARAQSAVEMHKSQVCIQNVYRRALEDLMPLAEAKRIDIGVNGESDVRVWASEVDMTVLVKNLVDNAIRYTPEAGRVDLSVVSSYGHALLSIRDTGPGIPMAERDQVFDPFYRTLGSGEVGSGLGLSVVKAIADRIGADVRLEFGDTAHKSGLNVVVRIPETGPQPSPQLP
jgi:two-component system OmpR family sensor kinase